MCRGHDPAAPRRGAPGPVTRRAWRAALALFLALGAGCRGDARQPARGGRGGAAAPDSAADSTATARPARPETTWVSLASLGSGGGAARRKRFETSRDGFRVIVELREPTTTLSNGRLIANVLSPKTALPLRTIEARIPPDDEARADTVFVHAEPGEYTILVLHDYGVRAWHVAVQEPKTVVAPQEPTARHGPGAGEEADATRGPDAKQEVER